MNIFDEWFDGECIHESYYANIESDRGGETYKGVARNLHPDWEDWKSIEAYKLKFGEPKRNTKIDIPELIELVKQFYKHTFYDKYNIGYIVCGSL